MAFGQEDAGIAFVWYKWGAMPTEGPPTWACEARVSTLARLCPKYKHEAQASESCGHRPASVVRFPKRVRTGHTCLALRACMLTCNTCPRRQTFRGHGTRLLLLLPPQPPQNSPAPSSPPPGEATRIGQPSGNRPPTSSDSYHRVVVVLVTRRAERRLAGGSVDHQPAADRHLPNGVPEVLLQPNVRPVRPQTAASAAHVGGGGARSAGARPGRGAPAPSAPPRHQTLGRPAGRCPRRLPERTHSSRRTEAAPNPAPRGIAASRRSRQGEVDRTPRRFRISPGMGHTRR